MRALLALVTVATIFYIAACDSTGTVSPADSPQAQISSGLNTLPADGVQPWESVDINGYVIGGADIPARDSGGQEWSPHRQSSAFPASSEFALGADRFLEGGNVSDNGDASTLVADGGPTTVTYALYRLVMGGVQPGAVAVDANLGIDLYGKLSNFWVGVSDYGAGTWQWRGPFNDAQVAFTLDDGDYTSSLGNTFIAIAVYDGSQLDLVGVTVSAQDSGDTTAPPALASAPQLTPLASGIEVEWLPVIAGDLAGYRVYWSYSPFAATTDNGVQSVGWLENTTRLVLPAPTSRLTWIGISAVDVNGNESAMSPVASAKRLSSAGAPILFVSVSPVSALRNESVTLGVIPEPGTPVDSYDFDLDGDGVFEITGTTATAHNVPTDSTGIIRPRVRASNADGTAVALGSVSLIVSGNQRPVANAQVNPSFGPAPLLVNMNGTGEDFDGSIAEYAWDFDGDGIFDHNSPADGITAEQYNNPGLYNAKLRVTDDQGAWDVDTVAVQVTETGSTTAWTPATPRPDESGVGGYSTLLVVNGRPAIGYVSFVGFAPGPVKFVRASNATGTTWVTPVVVDPNPCSDVSMAIVDGNPALSYYDTTNGDLMFVRASDADGSAWGTPIVLDGLVTDVGTYTTMLIVAGNPAISYKDETNGNLRYIRATSTDGSTWGLPADVDAHVNDVGFGASMALINGNPAISYWDSTTFDVKYVRATHPTGITWGLPQTGLMFGASTAASTTVLAELNGLPLVIFHDNDEQVLLVSRSITEDGGGGWLPQDIEYGKYAGALLDVEIVDGVVNLVYMRALGEIVFRRAANTDGTTWLDAEPVGAYGTSGGLSLEMVAGKPAVSFGHLNFEAFTYGLSYWRRP